MYKLFSIVRWVIAILISLAGLFVSICSEWFKSHIIISCIIFTILGISPLFLDRLVSYIKLKNSWGKLISYSKRVISRSCRTITGIADSIQLPEITKVTSSIDAKQIVIITGESGVGKSGLIVEISQKLKHVNFIFVDSKDICCCTSLGDIDEIIGLTEYKFSDTIRAKAKTNNPVVVVIDQCDSIWRINGRDIIIKLLNSLAEIKGLGIVVVCRKGEAIGLKPYIQERFNREVCEVIVENLDKNTASKKLQQLGFTNISDDLNEMATNLFFLSLIGDLLSKNSNIANLSQVTTLLDLWDKYRDSLESELLSNNDKLYRITDCAAKHAKNCLINERGTCEITSNHREEEKVLISRGVLVPDPMCAQRYRFRHENLRDYMYAFDAVNGRAMNFKKIQEELGEQAGLIAPVVVELSTRNNAAMAASLISEVLDG